jgi:plasmid maintenance system antidote protein VapI
VNVSIFDRSGNKLDAQIRETKLEDLQLLKKWKFDWSENIINGGLCFKIVKDDKIQGLLKLEWENGEYVIMKNIETAPHNFGSKGKFVNIAEILISFACYQTFKLNFGPYKGYLGFIGKGALIEYYEKKYNAQLVFKERMIIPPNSGAQLVKKYLGINFKVMKNIKYFDHLIGDEGKSLSNDEIKIYQRIIKAHYNEQPLEQRRIVQKIGIRLEMEDYLSSDQKTIINTGRFLERLLIIYDIKKSEFAEFIGIEKTNFYSLLKGRRKFNYLIAIKVGEIFKIEPELWVFIEAKNEMKKTKSISNKDRRKYSLPKLLKKSKLKKAQ